MVGNINNRYRQDGNKKVKMTNEEIKNLENLTRKPDWALLCKNKLRVMRVKLLTESDHMINKMIDAGEDVSEWRTYRQKLRDITKAVDDGETDYKKIPFPTKPK